MIRDLLHADRVLRLLGIGLSYQDAVAVDDDSAALLIEAHDIAFEGCDDDDDGDCLVFVGYPE